VKVCCFSVIRVDFPHLASQGNRAMKSTPVKGTSAGGSLSRQKSVAGKPAEQSLSSSPASAQASLRGKRDAIHSGKSLHDWLSFHHIYCPLTLFLACLFSPSRGHGLQRLVRE
jgi:hypothetical protein